MPENFITEESQESIDLSLGNNPDILLSEDSRRSSDAILQGIERTSELEFSLENKESPKPEKSSQVSRRNFLKAMAIGAATVLVGGISEAEPSPEIKKKYDEMLQRNKEKSEKLIERLGIRADIAEIARKNEFFSDVKIENGAGPYIIHIGQMHKNPIEEESERDRDRVIRVQKNIEGAILSFKKTGKTGSGIYLEGCFDNREWKEDLEKISQEKKILWDWDINIPKYFVIFEQIKKGDSNDIYSYIYLQRLRYISTRLEGINPGDKKRLDEVEAFINGPQGKKIEDNIYMRGAVLKMFLDGEIDIKPTETMEANQSGIELMKQEQAKIDKNKPEDGVYSNEEHQKEQEIKIEYGKKEEGPVMRAREDIAVEKITSAQDNNDLTLLVFGDAHDFTDVLEAHNKANPQKRMGLIKLKSRLCL